MFTDRYTWSADSLRLHWRDYPGDPGRPAILCLPGLTRNARDFEPLAERHASRGWRVLCPSLRGRGESGYAKDAMSYTPLTYLHDLTRLLTDAEVTRAVIVGTSLGGILALLLASTQRGLAAGVVLNDIGPKIEPAGLERIRAYVGRATAFPSWLHAARAIEEVQAAAFPRFAVADWLAMAKRTCRLAPSGRIVFDYDPRIAEPFRLPGGGGPGVDLWPTMAAVAGVPALSVRGGLSDILSLETQARMVADAGMTATTVADVGHAPTLEEPEAVTAVDAILERVAEQSPSSRA